MALSILHLLRDLQNTPFGPLSICDVKTSDLGLRKDFQIVIIDYDMIFTKPVLDDFISQPHCVRNEDCDFFDCKSECDVSRGRCSSRMTTNNFQVRVLTLILELLFISFIYLVDLGLGKKIMLW